MKRTVFILCVLLSFVTATVFFTTSGCNGDKPGDSDSLQADSLTAMGITKSYAVLPLDLTQQTQAAADTFSWLSFIAINWPADTNDCVADTTKSILTGGGPVVWETYISTDQVFVAPGTQPAMWCANASPQAMKHLPASVLELSRKTGINRFIHQTAKSPHELNEASGGPLVDQNGRFARYEVRMNWDEYNYITTNSLYNKSGQQNFVGSGNTFDFPAGPTSYGPVGAIEFKAAWKVLGDRDDPSRFYTIQAIVYNDESMDPSPGPNPVTLGLVGLHIAHKTASQHNWVWSTFEQVDNLTKSFFNPACDTCTPNQPIAGKNIVELNPNGTPAHSPTQVTRVNATDDPLAAGINQYFQRLLKGSVWANYALISTQWLLFENMTPLYLANSVQETYLQGPNPPSYGGYPLKIDEPYYADPLYKPFSPGTSSSCMGCHYTAKAVAIRSDFSFILNDAQ